MLNNLEVFQSVIGQEYISNYLMQNLEHIQTEVKELRESLMTKKILSARTHD